MLTALRLFSAVLSLALLGCSSSANDGPPELRMGDSICDECGMILSDQRFATATIVNGPRGPEPRVFDDFNCQVNYESANSALTVLKRWSHDYATLQWIDTTNATFLIAPSLHTPMASHTAAFRSKETAEAEQKQLQGTLYTFENAWEHLESQSRQTTPDPPTE